MALTRVLVALAATLALASASGCADAPLDKTRVDLSFSWHGVIFEWPCLSTKNIYVSSGRYIPKNVISTRVQFAKDYVYVAMPRYRPGVPVTLARANLKTKACAPVFCPFPCWSLQEEGNCNALQNVVDIYIDINEILWVLDVGVVNTLEQPIRRCPPKVIGFCTKTGKVVKVIDLSSLVCSASRLQYIVADVAQDGFTYLYISDAATRSVIVYDVHRNRGFRVMLPKAVTDGCTSRDVLYLSLVRRNCGSTILYLSYLSSTRLFSIRTEYLRRGTPNGRLITVGNKPAKIVCLGTDGGSAVFFRYKGEGDIYMWNTNTCFKSDNFQLVQKGHGCRLSTHVAPGYKRLMWTLESNFHDYIQGTTGCVGASIKLQPIFKGCE
ncbi:dopaminechrome tautomerase-like [Hetaerina americana]|uniref:dopaminechrome tautomerase-like n=1 Tax=Hetaerina americana TaxID=62018 RepID=UPI003A7F55D4